MTDDFKSKLLKYLTGKIEPGTPMNYPSFPEVQYYHNDLYNYIISYIGTPQSLSFTLIKGKSGNGEELDESLLYGVNSDDHTGFMIILDKMYNPIQFINSYSSGTRFGRFEHLIIDEDGRFYGIEQTDTKKRFVMLNNILAKGIKQPKYEVVLRQSYNLPDELQDIPIKQFIKKPLGNKYLFCTTIINGQTLVQQPTLIELTINVGMPNDWITYQYSSTSCTLNSVWASWDMDDNLKFKMIALWRNPPLTNGTIYVFSGSSNTISLDYSVAMPEPKASFIQSVILNETTAYLSYCDTVDGVYNQYIYNISDTLTQIYVSDNEDVALPGNLIKSDLYTDGINVFVTFNLPKADNKVDYYIGIIYNNQLYYNNFGDLTYDSEQTLYATNVFHQYNLYNYYLQLGNTAYVASSIFNNLNYNGPVYEDIDCLVPFSGVLTDDAGVPLFARNLYNKVVADNTTISTIEIPNTILNYNLGSAYNIGQEILKSKTNVELVRNIETIDKNIYETVDINFYNTLNMVNRNNPSNEIINLPGAVRLNKSSSNDVDYYSSQGTKVRINYTDGTYYILAVDPSTQITITNGIATYSFDIYVPNDKNIKDIDIMSYDEKTIYTNIKGTFTQGKYYNITQDVYVE